MSLNKEENQMENLKLSKHADIHEKILADILWKGDEVRFARRLHQEKHQAGLENMVFKEQENKNNHIEQKIVDQQCLMTRKTDETENLRKEKLKQQLRLGTQEIRDLESQLRACYVGKGIHAQMKEKQVQRVREELREKAHLEAQKIAWKEWDDVDQKAKEDDLRKKYALRLAQQEQMIEKQKRKVEAYRAFVQEKLMLDAVVQEIIEEDRRNAMARMRRQRAHQKDIGNFIEAQRIWREKQHIQLEEENKRIHAYVEMQTKRELDLQQEIQRKWEAHSQTRDHLARKLYEEQMRSMEKQQVFQELAEEEVREAQEARIRQELQAAIQKRIDLRLAMVHQQKERILQLERESQKEQQLRQEMLEEWARQDRLYQMTAERKRIKLQEHRQAVERLLKERRIQRNLELEQIMRDHEAQLDEERARELMIEEERIRLLQQHAENLLGFMPKGLIKESDLMKLGTDFTKTFYGHGRKEDPCS